MICLCGSCAEGTAVRLDRVAQDIYILASQTYAQVTATVLLTDDGVIVVDTMPFPHETQELIAFIEGRAGREAVRYVVNSHHHADHIYGTCFFPEAEVIAHDECRRILQRLGAASLARAKREIPALASVELRLPDMTFTNEMRLHLGHRELHLFHTPGHSADGISIYVAGEKALIAGDTVMPVPHISSGNIEQLRASLYRYLEIKPSFIIQGHGNVLLRGEIAGTLTASLSYLDSLERKVADLIDRGGSPRELRDIDIESCGISRIPLDGLVSSLHLDNLLSLYKQMSQARS